MIVTFAAECDANIKQLKSDVIVLTDDELKSVKFNNEYHTLPIIVQLALALVFVSVLVLALIEWQQPSHNHEGLLNG
jgi:hypothetical protein